MEIMHDGSTDLYDAIAGAEAAKFIARRAKQAKAPAVERSGAVEDYQQPAATEEVDPIAAKIAWVERNVVRSYPIAQPTLTGRERFYR